MLNQNYHALCFVLFSVISLTLSGCGSAPSHIILAPQVAAIPSNLYQGQQANLQVQDLRTSGHMLQILTIDKPAKLYSAAKPLSDVLQQQLNKQFSAAGLAMNGVAATQITVIVDSSQISVQQEMVQYKATTDIRLRVIVEKGQQKQTSHFNSKGSSNGPLKADIAVLERDLNQQLGNLISEIVKSTEIRQFIQS